MKLTILLIPALLLAQADQSQRDISRSREYFSRNAKAIKLAVSKPGSLEAIEAAALEQAYGAWWSAQCAVEQMNGKLQQRGLTLQCVAQKPAPPKPEPKQEPTK
jgi:hypothetical protein